MSDKVIAYKPFLFRTINTTGKTYRVPPDQIFNLDSYHKIERDGNNVRAVFYSNGDRKIDYIAHCNNEDGARWVMDCIMRRQTTTEEEVISVEQNGYSDTPAYF